MKKFNTLILFLMLSTFVFAQDKPEVTVGGALRYNYNYSSWKEGQKDRGGDFGYDVFRINAKASYKDIKLNAEYRFYSSYFGGAMLKQGWLGYDLNKKNNLQLGLTQVPFGITSYNSHSWFFSMNYYVGLEDDHDMGLKLTHSDDTFDYAIAFFKNAEELKFGATTDLDNSRYAYDVSSITDTDGNLILRNKEVNQLNGKIVYKTGNDHTKHRIGMSVEYGGLYNLDTQETGDRYAISGHYQLKSGNFDVMAAYVYYQNNPENPEGQPDDLIAMSAYGAPYLVAAEATTYTLGIAYSIPVEWGPISSLQFYNDFGMLDKANEDYADSFMNDLGVLITAGSVYTYVDYAMGKNQPWLGSVWTDALGAGTPNEDWEARFNINIGYYF